MPATMLCPICTEVSGLACGKDGSPCGKRVGAFGERGKDGAAVPGTDAVAVLDELRDSGSGGTDAGLADLREAPLDDVADISAGHLQVRGLKRMARRHRLVEPVIRRCGYLIAPW